MALNAEYVKDHMGVDAATFGNLIIEAALAHAVSELGGGEKDVVSVPITLSVSEMKTRGCVRVCYQQGNFYVCVHKRV